MKKIYFLIISVLIVVGGACIKIGTHSTKISTPLFIIGIGGIIISLSLLITQAIKQKN